MDKSHNLITSVAFCFIFLLVGTMSGELRAQDINSPSSESHSAAKANTTVDGVVLINQKQGVPVIISKPGSYRLSSNLTVPANTNGIVIKTGGVTLDLNGFSITGSRSGDGITDNGVPQIAITIHNGNITNFFNGINLGHSSQNNIEQMRVSNNSNSGIITGHNAMVTGNSTLSNTFNGIEADTFSIVNRNNSSFNGNSGIALAQNSTASGNNVSGNLGVGFFINLCPVNIIENTAQENGAGNIFNGTGCTFANNNLGP